LQHNQEVPARAFTTASSIPPLEKLTPTNA
jgi:hypothetical protein